MSQPTPSPVDTLRRLAGIFRTKPAVSSGERAALRRLDPNRPGPDFWAFITRVTPELATSLTDATTPGWAASIQALATLGVFIELGSTRPGVALRRAGVSDLRLRQFLEAPAGRLQGLCRFFVQKGQSVDPTTLCLYALRPSPELEADIARDFYLTSAP